MNDYTIQPGSSVNDVDTVNKCDNCRCSYSKNEGVTKLKIRSSFCDEVPELEIWNALEFIYGISWKSFHNYSLEKGSSELSSQENIKFCSSCASLLSENYHSHHNFEKVSQPYSIVGSLKEFQNINNNSIKFSSHNFEYTNEDIEGADSNESLFDTFAFGDKEDLIQSAESIDTKYEPPPTLLENTTSPCLSSSLNKQPSVSSRKSSLRSQVLRIKVEKLSDENILALTNKIDTRKSRSNNRKLSKVKKSRETNPTNRDDRDCNKEDSPWVPAKHVKKSIRKMNKVVTTPRKMSGRKRSRISLGEANNDFPIEINNIKSEKESPIDRKNSTQSLQHANIKKENRKKGKGGKKTNPVLFQENVAEALKKVKDKTTFKRIHISGRSVCNVCGKDYGSYDTLKRHWMVQHGGGGSVCDVCGQRFKARGILKWHKLRLHASEEEKKKWSTACTVCGKSVLTFYLKSHFNFHHTEAINHMYRCDQCGKEYRTKISLDDHLLIHREGPQKCEICSRVFPSLTRLERHKAKIHIERERTFSCEKCSLKFYTAERLRAHQKTHDNTRKYICEECGKTFKYGSHFQRHLRCHKEIEEKGEGAFTCDVCNDGKTFKHSLSLRKHKNLMHPRNGRKVHKCSFCGKRLSSGTNLRTHEKMHKELPDFKPRIRQKLPGHMIFGTTEETSSHLPSSTNDDVSTT